MRLPERLHKTLPSLRFPIGNSLKKPFQLLLVFLGCLHLAGGPYSLLQGYAWIGMLVSYSQQDGLAQAAKDTFSGEKPCKLCCKIAEGREKEPESKAPLAPQFSGKIVHEMLLPKVTILHPPAAIDLPAVVFAGIDFPSGFPKASPPVPPPCRLA